MKRFTKLSFVTSIVWVCSTAFGQGQAFRFDLGDGVTASLDAKTGEWASLRTKAGGNLIRGREQAVLEVCDLERGSQFVPVDGPLSADGRQQATLEELALALNLRYEQQPDHVRANVTVVNRDGRERGLVVRFCVPVDAVGWQWWDDVQTQRRIQAGDVYQNVHPIRHFADLPEFRDRPATKLGYHSRNFCAAVSGKAGLALAFPLDQPRICRLTYDAKERLLYAAFDLALSSHTRPSNQASVSVIFYACDPKWGLRSALSKYYQWHPAFFRKHVKKEGMWMAFNDLEQIDNVNELGFQFQEGARNLGYDDKLGVYSLTYFTHAGLYAWIPNYDPEKDPPPSRERVMAAMSKRFERDTKTKGAFQACGLGEADGKLQVWPMTVYGHLISQFNPDPDLVYGRYKLDHMNAVFAAYRKRGGELDGFYYDGLPRGLNYRADHFPHAAFPPIWDPKAKKAMLYNSFSSAEFAKEAARRLHAVGKYTMMNGAMSSSPFTAPYVDVMGSETGLRIKRPSFNYVRMICGRKPFVTLLKGNYSKYTHEDIETFMRRCAAYGVYPGFFDWSPSGLGPGSRYWDHAEWYERDRLLFRRYMPLIRRMNAAGWDPLTHATYASPNVQVERFGKAPGSCYFALLNDTAAPVGGRLSIDAKALGMAPADLVVADEVSQTALPMSVASGRAVVPVDLHGGQLAVLHVATERQFARSQVSELRRVLADRKFMATLDETRPELLVHWRPYRDGYARAKSDCLVLDNTAKPARLGAWQWVMLYQRQPRPLEIRARVKAQGVAKGFTLHATVCHVTKFTKRVRKAFALPAGSYDWRDVRFAIEPDRPVRSIQLTASLDRAKGRALLDNIVVAEVAKPDVNYVVDSAFEEWYEQPNPEQAEQLAARMARFGATVNEVDDATGVAPGRDVIAACGKALEEAASVKDWIESNGLGNPCRRALRDLADCERRLRLVIGTLAHLTGPIIEVSQAAIPGQDFAVSVAAKRRGRYANVTDASLTVSEGWRVTALGRDAETFAQRFLVRVPKEARVNEVVQLTAGARIKAVPGAQVQLTQTRKVTVVRAADVELRSVGDAGLVLDVTNNGLRPLRLAYEMRCPAGWQAQPPKADLVCPPGQSAKADIQLRPSSATTPGQCRFSVAVSTPDGEFEARSLTANVRYVPSRLNLLKNAGFEDAKTGIWHPYGDGCAVDGSVAHSGRRSLKLANPKPARRGAHQTIALRQKHRCPITVRGWGKGEGVEANLGKDCSIYVDIYYMDGTPLYGNALLFSPGTHDWEFRERIIEPKKPIKHVNVYALHRRGRGTVWFDDLFVAELPTRKGNLAGEAKATVDSAYSKYKAAPINDGVVHTEGLHWTEAAWASAEKPGPHWIQLTFPADVTAKRVVVYWSLDAGVPRTSAELVVQTKSAEGWEALERVRPAEPAASTVVGFDRPIRTRALRFWQPAGRGPKGRPNLMWVREVEVYPR